MSVAGSEARKVLLAMQPGDRLELTTTDAMSVVDIPVFCAQSGHIMVNESRQADGFVFLIERARDDRDSNW